MTDLELREYLSSNYSLTNLPDAHGLSGEDDKNFKKDLLEGFDKICGLKNSFAGKSALVMGHGPSLLDIDKEKYKSHLKITCNDFHKINFFEDFRPDFWCAANSYDAINIPFKICLEENIKSFVTIPLLHEFSDLLKIAREGGHIDTVYPWLWEHQIFQNLLAQDYGLQKIYSRCNTITNHMIAFAMWLGCDSISVAGFDLSFHSAIETTGMTHAGYNKEDQPLDAFDDPRERRQILGDLKYLCTLASHRGVKIHNLSHEANRLPESLT